MAITQQLSSKGNVKKTTNNDLPFSPAQPVISSYYATSTASQTVINMGFSIQVTGLFANTDVFWLFVDGKKLDLGSSNDYTFTNIGSDGTSSQVTLNYSIVANLNIQAFKLGLKPEVQFTMDNRFTQLYANQSSAFQGFVSQTDFINTATTSAGTPAAGTFYSSITGRAPMIDLSQDLKPRLGVERIMTQSLQIIQGEFGPNGENVWGVQNDTFGQIRFVGSWVVADDAYGTRINYAANTTDVVEVTFYGTGLNGLYLLGFSGNNLAVSIDGGAETTGLATGSYSNVLNSRNYSTNQVIPLASGLALGIHTVKIRQTNATSPSIYGFEIINQISAGSNLVSVNPGIVYSQGQKNTLASQSTLAYNAAVTGTTGGRVVEYISSAGARGQAFTAAAASPSYLTSASHTNEEVARTYYWREFAAGRSDDFSAVSTTSTANNAFTLDDGTTTLAVTGAQSIAEVNQDTVYPYASGGIVVFTFIGTGLDIFINIAAVSTATITVDGVTASSSYLFTFGNNKIVSGLAYGTHEVKITRNNSSAFCTLSKLTVYQPKTPSIPSGAVQIGSYNVMGNYVALSSVTNAPGYISQGVLRKQASVRETIYTGTWTNSGVSPTAFDSGFGVSTATSGSTWQYTFFGTGFEYEGNAGNAAQNATFQIDGSSTLNASNSSPTNGVGWTGALTTAIVQSGTGLTFTSSTGTLGGTQSGSGIFRVQISGLTLGYHTVKFTTNNTATYYLDTLDIITPIHSYKSNLYADLQNTLLVGSNAISDDRQIQPVKGGLPATKAWSQAVGISSSPTTTSSVLAPMPDMSCTVKSSGGPLRISFEAEINSSVAASAIQLQLYVDGYPVGTLISINQGVAGDTQLYAYTYKIAANAGSHKVDLYWLISGGGTMTATGTRRVLLVEET